MLDRKQEDRKVIDMGHHLTAARRTGMSPTSAGWRAEELPPSKVSDQVEYQSPIFVGFGTVCCSKTPSNHVGSLGLPMSASLLGFSSFTGLNFYACMLWLAAWL
ncbi:hypothetical protein TRIATDRAFT_298850 [Trichoderma atroviride IMI 206040]|uniref:Uncharacterized protein n=1 Tax=Hypocrea atroviridis (strain ATCC 20476 / IMI 206040) TaxID=452589 RepID=G9NR66_HYPAI|nr:uncharacterized protein TRIATDRAFT_298850 [Trichoderma atroviride IMI 206040]EHK47035.1 hypothetical protein TRIATDRAFT_298850 [Trichoderma atroviride IMI 206040]